MDNFLITKNNKDFFLLIITMKAIDRIYEYINYKGMKISDFERANSISNGYLSKMKMRSAGIGEDILTQILENCPEINPEWLILGEGEMIKGENVLKIHNPPYPEAINGNVVVPLYDIEAAANLTKIMAKENENIIGYISIPNMPSVDGAVEVRGDSMYPIIKSGDIVVFKWVSSPEYITFGEMYLVSYIWDNDVHVTVKYINRSPIPEHIRLVSYNSHYEPLDVPVSCIQSIALVKVSIRYNTLS